MPRLPCAVVQGPRYRYMRGHRDQVSALPAAYRSEASEPFPDRQRSGSTRGSTLWLYVPNLKKAASSSPECPFAPAMQGSTSVLPSRSRDIALSVTSSGKAMLRPLSWRGWMTRPWITRLYGAICDPSTAALGAAAFISSLPAIPASPSALQARAEAQTIPAISGPKSPESSAKSGRVGFSPKTSKVTSHWDLPKSPRALQGWATLQKRDCSRRERQALAIAGDGFSSWPTPTATDAGYYPDLTICAGALKVVTPIDISPGSGGQFSLRNATRSWTHLWLAMKALGWTPVAMPKACPSSPPVRVSFSHGNGCFVNDLTSNPRFYEWAMGWPINWTAPGESVTEFAVWLRRSRGALSRLTSAQTGGHDHA